MSTHYRWQSISQILSPDNINLSFDSWIVYIDMTCDMWNGWIFITSKPWFWLFPDCLKTLNFFLGLKCIFLCRRAQEPGNLSADLVDDSSGYDGASDKGRDQVKPVTGNVVSWGEEQVGALRSWQPALQRSITTILRQMHLRSSLLVLSPGDIWDQRGNLGRSGVASSAAPLLPDQKGGKFIWVTSNQQCHSTHIKSSHQPWNWVLRSFLG